MRMLAAGILLVTTACAAADHCQVEEPRNQTIEAAGIERIFLEASGGSLKILGVSEGNQIRIRGLVCTRSRDDLSRIQLRTTRNGSELRLVVEIPERLGGRYDLDIEVPRSMILVVRDGSGAATIRNVAALDIVDGSGELRIGDIAGEVNVRDGSGSLDIQRTGTLVIEDGSGSISVRDVTGTVRVRDGSGSIDVRNVSNDVVVESDGSGSIEVSEVKGDFRVERDGSGGVSHHAVQGSVDVN